MRCPRCVDPVPPASPQCARCGFDLRCLDEEFGNDVILLDRLTDAAHCLRLREKDSLNQLLDDFERQFPQLFVAVYIGMLPPMTSIRQFGFWLLNHAAVSSVDVSRPNEQGLLIVMDLQSRVVGVVLGYMVERFLSEQDLQKCLKPVRANLIAEDYHRGLRGLLRRLSRTLRKRSRQARKDPDRFVRQARPAVGRPFFRKLKDTGETTPPVSVGSDRSIAISNSAKDSGMHESGRPPPGLQQLKHSEMEAGERR